MSDSFWSLGSEVSENDVMPSLGSSCFGGQNSLCTGGLFSFPGQLLCRFYPFSILCFKIQPLLTAQKRLATPPLGSFNSTVKKMKRDLGRKFSALRTLLEA